MRGDIRQWAGLTSLVAMDAGIAKATESGDIVR